MPAPIIEFAIFMNALLRNFQHRSPVRKVSIELTYVIPLFGLAFSSSPSALKSKSSATMTLGASTSVRRGTLCPAPLPLCSRMFPEKSPSASGQSPTLQLGVRAWPLSACPPLSVSPTSKRTRFMVRGMRGEPFEAVREREDCGNEGGRCAGVSPSSSSSTAPWASNERDCSGSRLTAMSRRS